MQINIIKKLALDKIACLVNRHVSKQAYHIKADQNIMWVKVEVFNFLNKGRRVKDMML